ncbi:MAG TPA: lipoprotein insertase outer membrane protein LolB [Burkholderiales bacterium]|nr:lipoprotein insertase outer membrane protein LolB [Burkholderiales bacterium]
MRFLLLPVLLLAGACAQLETRVPQDVRFDVAGRLAVRYGNEAFSGNLAWRHAGGSDELLITSSLGAGIARLVREGEHIVLTTAEPKEYRGTDAEALTEEVLGFRVPVAGLADWVRGRAGDHASQVQRGADGRLMSLEQDGWKVEYLDYQGELPSRLRLTYPGIELRLAISQWK